jgi:UDP-GlcNAc3NAcA epimerase
MSRQFFKELNLPAPDVHLGVRGGGHAVPTGRMLIRMAPVFEEIRPDWILVYGDTTSTLAGALAGAQCGIRVAHVEAGLRSFLRNQPEERNRLIADRLSDLRFCPNRAAIANLKAEGLTAGNKLVGDPMHEALALQWPRARRRKLVATQSEYLFCTLHRAENTDDFDRMKSFVTLLDKLPDHVLLPLHPRTSKALRRHGLWGTVNSMNHVQTCPPMGYLDTLQHIKNARAVLTDSGGVQREAAWLGTPCLTLRPVTEWTDLVDQGHNTLVDLSFRKTLAALRRPKAVRKQKAIGNTSERIAKLLLNS